MKEKTRWVHLTFNRTIKRIIFNLFGFKFDFKVSKRKPTRHLKNLKIGPEIGEIYGVKFIKTTSVKPGTIKV